jgi:predicted MPP superfamily phosphohydrolase
VIVSFGNHEYGVERAEDEPFDPELPDKMESALTRWGCIVLRNGRTTIDRGVNGDRLWFVGLDDLWFGDFSPPRAFADVPRDEAVIALSHNPDTAEQVARHRPGLILAGHTHGGQVRLPGIGAIHLNTQNQKLDQGMFKLSSGSALYVSRGVGYIRRIRFYCRPEVPIFRLRSSA